MTGDTTNTSSEIETLCRQFDDAQEIFRRAEMAYSEIKDLLAQLIDRSQARLARNQRFLHGPRNRLSPPTQLHDIFP